MKAVRKYWHYLMTLEPGAKGEARQKYLVLTCLLMVEFVWLLFTGLAIIGWFFDVIDDLTLLVMMGMNLSLTLAYVLSQEGYWKAGRQMLFTNLLLFAVYGNVRYGIDTPSNILYGLIPMLAAIFFGGQGLLVAIIVSLCVPITVYFLSEPISLAAILDAYIPFLALIMGIVLLQWFSNRQMQHTISINQQIASDLLREIEERGQVETALRQEEERYRNIIESAPIGMHIYRLEKDGRLVFVEGNPAADEILGVDNADFVGQTIEEAFPPLADTEIPERYRQAAAEGVSWSTTQINYQHEKISGAYEVYAFRTAPNMMTAAFRDITAQKEYEEALVHHLEFERLLVVNAARFINLPTETLVQELNLALEKICTFLDVDAGFVFRFSDDLSEMTAYTDWSKNALPGYLQEYRALPSEFSLALVESLQTVGMFRVRSVASLPIQEKWLRKIMTKTGVESIQVMPIKHKGKMVGFLGLAYYMPNARWTGESVALLEMLAEMIANAWERVAIESDLRESEARYRAIVEDQTELIVRWLPEGTRTFVNKSYARFFGKKPEALIGTSFLGFLGQEQRVKMRQNIQAFSPENPVISYEERIPRADGMLRWLHWTDRGIFNKEGRLVEIQSVGRDIHDKRMIEDALRIVAQGVSTEFGESFFHSLVSHLADVLNTDQAFVGKLIGDQQRRITTIAVCEHGEIRSNFEYDLSGTPCDTVVDRELCVYPEKVAELFPEDRSLAAKDIQSYVGAPLFDSDNNPLGLLAVLFERPLREFSLVEAMLQIFATRAAAELERTQADEILRATNIELAYAYDITLEGWAKALELRDKETEGHCRRVTDLSINLAKELGMSGDELVHVRRGALLHDIGKMGIPDEILLKPGPLSEYEWDVMHQHPIYAYDLLTDIPFLQPALDIPYCHHEWWDGSGYPRGLAGEEIPLAARIFAVVDVWDALRSDRPYRESWPDDEVVKYLHDQAGKQFDPLVVNKFFEIMNRR